MAAYGDCASLTFECAGATFAQLLPSAFDLEAVLDGCFGAAGCPTIALDGEFTHVRQATGGNAMNMAVLTLMDVAELDARRRLPVVVSLQLPVLLAAAPRDGGSGGYLVDESTPAVGALFRLLRRARLVTWDGARNDLPALAAAFPRLGLAAGASDAHRDAQREFRDAAAAGAIDRETPLTLAGAAAALLGVVLDKSFRRADWGGPCSAAMLAYAARDVVVTARLWRLLHSGAIPAPAAPPLTPTELVDRHWTAAMDALYAPPATAPPGKRGKVANFVVSSCAPLARLLTREPALRAAVVAAVDARLWDAAAHTGRPLPAWVASTR